MNSLRIIIGLIIWTSITVYWAFNHSKIIKNGNEPGGIKDYFLRVLLGVVVSFIAYIGIPYDRIWNFVGFLILESGLFWIIFDLSLNLFRSKEWNYVSTTNGKWSDMVFHGNFAMQAICKLIVIVLGIYLM